MECNHRITNHLNPLPTWGNLSGWKAHSPAERWWWDLWVSDPGGHEELWPTVLLCELGGSRSQHTGKHQPPAPPAATWRNTWQHFIRDSPSNNYTQPISVNELPVTRNRKQVQFKVKTFKLHLYLLYESQRLIWRPIFYPQYRGARAQSWGSPVLSPHNSRSSCLSDWSGWPRNQSASGQFKSWYCVHYCKPLTKSAQTDETTHNSNPVNFSNPCEIPDINSLDCICSIFQTHWFYYVGKYSNVEGSRGQDILIPDRNLILTH